MKYQVLIKPEAQGDLEKIFFWYEEKVLGLGDKFIEDFENKLGLIIHNHRFPTKYIIKTSGSLFCLYFQSQSILS